MRRLRLPKLLPLIPPLLGAALLLVPLLLWSWNMTGGQVLAHIRYKTAALRGVVEPVTPVPAQSKTMWSGSYQKYRARIFGAALPIFPDAVRLHNQLLYSVFGMSSLSRIVIGRDLTLYEEAYIDEYCHRDVASFKPAAAAAAAKLRQIQDYYGRLGKPFLYMVTPTKPPTYPEGLPPETFCPAAPADRAGKMPTYRAALDQAGVRYIDATLLTVKNRDAFPIPLFPRGGTHWDEIAAGLAVQAALQDLATRYPVLGLAPVTLQYSFDNKPVGIDADLAGLLNLIKTDLHYPVGRASVARTAVTATGWVACRPVHLVEVGDSFLWGFNDVLNKLPCAPKIDFYYYYSHAFADYPDRHTRLTRIVDPAPRRKALTGDADIVLLEENEWSLTHAFQITALYNFLIENRETQ